MKEQPKILVYDLYMAGKSVSEISKQIKKSKSTVYRYIQEIYDAFRYPEMREEIKKVLLCGNFPKYVNELSWRDVCLITRKFHLYGFSREERTNSILKYFSSYSLLGVYPENLNRAIVKRAYKKTSFKTHPDMNKNLNKAGIEFIAVQNAYNYIMAQVA